MSSLSQPRALILQATGTNRDPDVSEAIELAGGKAEIVHLNQLRAGEREWNSYQMLVLAGGFSYADALGAGKLLALDLQAYFAEEVGAFVASGKPVIGICNGFQALVKSGILPGGNFHQHGAASPKPAATLTFNDRGHFECRWVQLAPESKKCIWTQNLTEDIYCPVAHGEGNFVPASQEALQKLHEADQVALTYVLPDGTPAQRRYPANPNGSVGDIAGICNSQGNVLGLMPHPENHIYPYQHPRWTRLPAGKPHLTGLPLFRSGVWYASQL